MYAGNEYIWIIFALKKVKELAGKIIYHQTSESGQTEIIGVLR